MGTRDFYLFILLVCIGVLIGVAMQSYGDSAFNLRSGRTVIIKGSKPWNG